MFQRTVTRSGAIGAIFSPSRVQLTPKTRGHDPVARCRGSEVEAGRENWLPVWLLVPLASWGLVKWGLLNTVSGYQTIQQ